ncbi:MAG: hypothetical protein ABIJ21_05615 [Nanoarchaeota archaeon]
MKMTILIGLLIVTMLFSACAKQVTDITPPTDTGIPPDTTQNQDTVNPGTLTQESQIVEETTDDLDDTEVDTQVTSTEDTLENW